MQKNHRKRTGRNRKRPRIIKPYERKQKREEDSVQLIPVEFGENGIEELGSNDAPLVEPASSTFAGIENLPKGLINKLQQIEERLPKIQLDSLEKYQELLQQIGMWVERNVPSQHKSKVLWRIAELIDQNPYYQRYVSGVDPNVTFKQTIFREGGIVARKVVHRNGREVIEAFTTPSFAMPGGIAPATLEIGTAFERQSVHRETLEDKLGKLGKIWIPIRKLGEGGGFGYPVEVKLDWNAVKELPIKELYEFWLKATAQYHKEDLRKKEPVEAWRNSLVEQLIALLQGKEFVAKLFFPERIKDEWSLNKCRKEARILCDIRHPNVIPAYDFVVDDHSNRFERDKIFYVMEKADGKLPEKGRLPRRKAAKIVLEAAYGVRELHRRGIIHRDIKPANIMILNGRAVILDPGLAKGGTDYSLEEVSTKTGAIAGTPAFMSPEQATSTKRVDEKADVYSLGATLYRLVTGRDPYTGEDALVILRQVVDETKKPLPLSSFGINDPGLQAIINGSMEKSVSFRMNLDGFISALESYLSLDPRQATKSIKTLVPSVPAGVKLGRKFKKLLGWARENIAKAAILALISVGLVTGGVGYCIKIRSEKQSRLENVVQLLERAETEFRNKNYGFIIDAKNDWEEKVRLAKEYGFDLSDEEKKFNELYSLAKVGKVIKETYLTGLEHIKRGEFSKGIDLLKKFIDESKSIDKNASLELNLHKKLKDAKEKLDQALIETLNEDYRFLKRTINRAEQDAKRVRLDELKEDLEQRQKAYRTFIQDTWEQVKIYNKDINEFAKKVEEKIKEFEKYSNLERLKKRLKETRTLEDKIFSFFEQRVIEQIEKADREKRYVDEVEWMKAAIEFYEDLIKNNEVSERLAKRLEERISEYKIQIKILDEKILDLALENVWDDNYNKQLNNSHILTTFYLAEKLYGKDLTKLKNEDEKKRLLYLYREHLWRCVRLVEKVKSKEPRGFPQRLSPSIDYKEDIDDVGFYMLFLSKLLKLDDIPENLKTIIKNEKERRIKYLDSIVGKKDSKWKPEITYFLLMYALPKEKSDLRNRIYFGYIKPILLQCNKGLFVEPGAHDWALFAIYARFGLEAAKKFKHEKWVKDYFDLINKIRYKDGRLIDWIGYYFKEIESKKDKKGMEWSIRNKLVSCDWFIDWIIGKPINKNLFKSMNKSLAKDDLLGELTFNDRLIHGIISNSPFGVFEGPEGFYGSSPPTVSVFSNTTSALYLNTILNSYELKR